MRRGTGRCPGAHSGGAAAQRLLLWCLWPSTLPMGSISWGGTTAWIPTPVPKQTRELPGSGLGPRPHHIDEQKSAPPHPEMKWLIRLVTASHWMGDLVSSPACRASRPPHRAPSLSLLPVGPRRTPGPRASTLGPGLSLLLSGSRFSSSDSGVYILQILFFFMSKGFGFGFLDYDALVCWAGINLGLHSAHPVPPGRVMGTKGLGSIGCAPGERSQKKVLGLGTSRGPCHLASCPGHVTRPRPACVGHCWPSPDVITPKPLWAWGCCERQRVLPRVTRPSPRQQCDGPPWHTVHRSGCWLWARAQQEGRSGVPHALASLGRQKEWPSPALGAEEEASSSSSALHTQGQDDSSGDTGTAQSPAHLGPGGHQRPPRRSGHTSLL